jgi:hypothetical protein
MTDENTVGREPIQIVEILQPACVETYGSSPCTAALGVTGENKCFNTRRSCQDPANYDGSFTIYWRFARTSAILPRNEYAESSGVFIKTHPIPMVLNVSTVPTQANIGGSDKNTSIFGRRSSVTITLKDIPWDDSVGDFYVSERPAGTAGDTYNPIGRGTFWNKWKARNPYHTKLTIRIYEGYIGQALSAMQVREYVLDRVNGPTNDRVTLTANDPLRFADDKRAQFPKASDIHLVSGITAVQFTNIEVASVESELTDAFGNTGTTRYLRIEDEILEYTGYANSGTNEWTLSGVTREALGTTADSHDAGEKCQRVGRYSALEVWNIAEDLLENHTDLDAAYINDTQWNTEGASFLSPYTLTATVAEPTAVSTLVGELMEQCAFFIWWDERNSTIPLKAIRPPLDDGVAEINDTSHILKDSGALREDNTQRISRVVVYYGQRDPTKSLTDIANYSTVKIRIDGDAESADQYDEIKNKKVWSRWLGTSAQATQTAVRLLGRLRDAVEIFEFRLDAKDRAIGVGDVLEITARQIVDFTGAEIPRRWQVISYEEIVPGEVVRYRTQTFEFYGRFWIWAPTSPPADYDAATEAQREAMAFFADDDGTVGTNKDQGYQWV